jgi:hypothetical protein
MNGQDDAVQLTHAVQDDRVLLTRNHDDFRNLPIWRWRCEPIIRALLLCARRTIPDQFTILNYWR